jgi:sulfite exporter TauE/SafE
MWQTIIISGLVLGLFSSVHCIGMCGPIALALPFQYKNTTKRVSGLFFYNFGRVVTYTLLGILFGYAGRKIFVAGWQQLFSLIAGIALLLIIIYTWIRKRYTSFQIKPLEKMLQKAMLYLLTQKSIFSLFTIGMLNGLLPCGMVYLALAGAIATGSVQGGAQFMFAYGLGTLPLMFAFALAGSVLSVSFRSHIKKLYPAVMCMVAVLLILRGLNLGIPYISPYFKNMEVISCH